MDRIGIFGGTFNPVHNTHLDMASAFVKQCNLKFCYFIPANISPFKINDEAATIVNATHRLKMLELALKNYNKFIIDDYEINKTEVSYSIHTIKYLKEKHKDAEFFLIIGEDQAIEFDKWKNFNEIIQEVKICITKRPLKFDVQRYIEIFKETNANYCILDLPESPYSSSIIREKIRNNFDVEPMLPKDVKEYIFKNNLYK